MSIRIRPAVPADAAAIARAHVASWQHAYRELLPQAFLDALSVAERTELWRNSLAKKVPVLIAEEDGEVAGEVAGFIALGPCRDQDAQPGIWEIWAMYLAPDYWSQGVGCALWLAAREACIANGAEVLKLWVIVGNERAIRFYRAAGFEAEPDAPMTFEQGGVTLEEIRMTQNLTPRKTSPASL